jgi:hypothetical protein
MSENQDHLGGEAAPNDFEDSDLSDADDLDSGDHPDLTDKEPNETHSSGMEAAGNSGSGYFKMYASELFPYAQWTGGSNIHASIGRNARVPVEHGGRRAT